MPIDYDALAKQAGAISSQPAQPDYDALAKQAGAVSSTPASEGQGSWLDSVGDYLKGFWSQANPAAVVTGARDLTNAALTHPIETVRAIGQSQDAVRLKAEEAFKQKNYAEGIRHVLGYLVPFLGPQIDAMGDKAQSGKVAEAVGEATGFGLVNGLPGSPAPKWLASKIPVVRVKPRLNAVGQAAIDFADRQGIPVPLSVRTGGRFARGLEALTENDLGGSRVAAASRDATASALQRTGQALADQISPGSVTKEQAGTGAVQSLQRDITNLHTQANVQYQAFHDLEKVPQNVQRIQVNVDQAGNPVFDDMPLPVDMAPVKAALQPILARYLYALPTAEQRASRGLKAIENIVSGPDWKPASTAELDLGALKEAARAEMPELRDTSQGLAASAVRDLDGQIRGVVAKAYLPGGQPPPPPGASHPGLQALLNGRDLTRQKWETADVLKSFGRKIEDLEPVQVFGQLTWGRDAGVERLREVAKRAPGEMPKIGRAYVEGLLETATRSGDFGRTQEVLNQWDALGPETKKLLFRNPNQVQDLNNFFRLARMASVNPNPSGTALVGAIGSHVATLASGLGMMVYSPAAGAATALGGEVVHIISNAALARMLYNPKASRALVQGMKVSLKSPAATASAANILKLAGDDARAVPVSE